MASRTIRISAPALVLTLLLAAGAATAQDDDDMEFEPHAYVGIAADWAIEQFQNDGGSATNEIGLTARLGYRPFRYVAAEVQYEWFPGFDDGTPDRRIQTVTGNLKGFVVNDNTGPFEPYVLGGAGVLFSDIGSEDDQGLALRMGGGMNLKFSDHVAFVVEGAYVLPVAAGRVDDLQYVSVVWGLQVGF